MNSEKDVLKRCLEEIRTLKEENEILRRSARAFGALAERLHVSLQEERRRGQDRRAEPRSNADRRQPPATQPELSSKH
jgi:hypothetical protein